ELAAVKLSANWMAACGASGEDARLYDTVAAVSELCQRVGLAIPVGKDSLSMRAAWVEARRQGEVQKEVVSPVSLIVTAFAPVTDVRRTLTPQLRLDVGETELLLLDLGRGRLGGSSLAQVFNATGEDAPDIDRPESLIAFFAAVRRLKQENLLLAYHDRSDGGLFVAAVEMAFAAHAGVTLDMEGLCADMRTLDVDGAEKHPEHFAGRDQERIIRALFNEEAGAVIQIRRSDREKVTVCLRDFAVPHAFVGHPNDADEIRVIRNAKSIFRASRVALQRVWSETGFYMQRLRDNPECAREAYDGILDAADPGLSPKLAFDLSALANDAPYLHSGARPRMAILREQGVNSQYEMAAAFDRAGFEAVDVHMSDLIAGRQTLADFKGLAACGGFSYGDVLGAGQGWARTILMNARCRDEFSAFFQRPDSFALGVCNGCQMMSALKTLIPGAEHWPDFRKNRVEQFEARFVQVEILPSPSLFFVGMAGSVLPVVVSHGEGRAVIRRTEALPVLRYVDHRGAATETYPLNPNGSPGGLTGVTTADGRFTIMMPHPERVFRRSQMSWYPKDWDAHANDASPWLALFMNARRWAG
ncbi:MAG: phosphoribosylformylglycinamidine synthase, partial [Zoogloeaceae bacterium]|nr:phosphoribosylformylglycinamidine synthase [Zoogloeaceae bacterium]